MAEAEPTTSDLVRQVAALVARHEILDVLARYCACVDDCDFVGLSEVFASDCVADYGPHRGDPLIGLAAVCEMLSRVVTAFLHTQHQLGQVQLTERADGSWDSTAYATAWHELRDGSKAVSRVRYLDRFVRTDEGWRIAERRMYALGTEGWPGTQYRFIERRVRARR
jgi:3-phenylpropionate/cinnamic acid dioxygenase small subunit